MDSRHFLILAACIVPVILVASNWNPADQTEECGDLTCTNRGRCMNFTCVCFDGLTGANCSEDVDCGSLNSHLTNALFEAHATAYDTYVNYHCKTGYQFPDIEGADDNQDIYRTVRCQEDGTWGPDLVDCEALCPVIPTWRGYIVDTNKRTSSTTVRYICYGKYPWYAEHGNKWKYRFENYKGGYEGEFTSTCGLNAEWDPPILPCIEMADPEKDDYQPKE